MEIRLLQLTNTILHAPDTPARFMYFLCKVCNIHMDKELEE